MELVNLNVSIPADFKGSFERLCQDIGMDIDTAVCVLVQQALWEKRIPIGEPDDCEDENDEDWDDIDTDVPGKIVTAEDLRRGEEELKAGFGVQVTFEELEILEQEGPDGPMYRELQRRHDEVKERLSEWRAAKGYPDE